MSTPILYKGNETDFSTLGLGPLRDATSALVTEERNGLFELKMKYPVKGYLFEELKNDRLIKADAGNKLKDQRFKIIRITKPIKGVVTVYAEHVSNLTQDLPLEPKVYYSGTAQSALNTWKSNIVDEHPLTVYSDISTTGSGTWTIDKVEHARRALGGVSGSILDTYGGEYRFDNYHIGLYAQRGDDSGALIAYGKNLIDLTQEEEIASTYTSVYPYSIVRNEGDDSEELVVLPERYIDSEHVENYARRKILVVDFSEDEVATEEQLRNRAKGYIEQNNIGIPKVNLKVKFVDLAKTLDYKNLKLVEEINLCDVVNIYYQDFGIHQKAKVIKIIWDVLGDRYEEIEIGEARASLSKSIDSTVDGKVNPIESRLNIVQIAANGKNKIFRGPDEPQNGMSLGDLWYKPIGDGEVEMYQYDGNSWGDPMVTTGMNNETKKAIKDAKKVAEDAGKSAQSTIDDIDEVVTEYGVTSLKDLFAIKIGEEEFETMFYQEANAIGLTYEEGGDTKAIIAISDGLPYIKGEHIVLDGDVIVDGTFTVSDEIFAEEMNISKFTTGTLNAAEVNLINVNAKNIVGENADLIRASFNGVSDHLHLNSAGLVASHSDGSETRLTSAGLYHREGGTNYETSYLNDVFTVTGLNRQTSNPYWLQLPSIYRGKNFKAVAVISDAYGSTSDNAYYNLPMLRVVTFVDQSRINYEAAKVPVVGYMFVRDIRNNFVGRRHIQVQVFVSY